MSTTPSLLIRCIQQCSYTEFINDATNLTHVTYTFKTEHGKIEVTEITNGRHIFGKAIASGQNITLASWGKEMDGFSVDESCVEKGPFGEGFVECPRDPKTVTYRFLEAEGKDPEAWEKMWVYLDKKHLV